MFSSLFLSFVNIPPENNNNNNDDDDNHNNNDDDDEDDDNNNNKQRNFSLLLSFLRKCPTIYMHPSSLHFIHYIFLTMRGHAKGEFSSPGSTLGADSYFGIRSTTVLPQ